VGSSGGCSTDTDGFGIASGWATEKLVASGRLSGLHRYMSLRWRSVSIFSKIVISAPVIKWRTWKVLVSSNDARNAEGDKEKVTNFSILLIEPACRRPYTEGFYLFFISRILIVQCGLLKVSLAMLVNFAQPAGVYRPIVGSWKW
jgi:hypothetical protein